MKLGGNSRRLRNLRDAFTFLTACAIIALWLKWSDLYYSSLIPSIGRKCDQDQRMPDESVETQSMREAIIEEKILTYPNNISHIAPSRASCAPWIPYSARKVLFVELHTWDVYYGPSKYKTGK